MSGQTLEALCFRLGERVFAVDIACIREILRSHAVTAVPRAPAHLAGVLNLRGELLPVFDLHRALLGAAPGEGTEETRLVVLRAGGRMAGVVVDQVLDVTSVPVRELQPVPGSRPGSSAVAAVFRSEGPAGEPSVVLLLRPSLFFEELGTSALGGAA